MSEVENTQPAIEVKIIPAPSYGNGAPAQENIENTENAQPAEPSDATPEGRSFYKKECHYLRQRLKRFENGQAYFQLKAERDRLAAENSRLQTMVVELTVKLDGAQKYIVDITDRALQAMKRQEEAPVKGVDFAKII